ncbi:hypothetical protein FVR03_08935 [Pontibacter qinzhouensis]|uniref:Lipoprotein n=1 Tax=Pontibacter qinzhouensis TaxID=2603253 RepID=A0A5C8K6S2_9BACT|nr:hypothetical protein [Pontibacter qinzhouensis]TXK47661.1 hypothetical protein FVR03_08935 [Pontibacter qinzhouensis]
MKKAFIMLSAIVALATGCTEKFVEPDPTAAGLEYYPVEVGDFRIYEVTDIKFRNNIGDTTRFLLRERVDTSFFDQTNTLNYKIVRSVKANIASQWQDDSVLVVTKSDKFVTETKDNTKRIKFVFPIKNGKVWSADAFNANLDQNRSKEMYTFQEAGAPATVGGKSYNQTVTVIQGTPANNLVQLDDRKEVYANRIGLVYRLFNKVTYCNDSESNTCPFGKNYKLNGHERIKILQSYGKM